ncbi:hypothetical protein [Mycobacterium sp. MS1601]|uniref:hypothetical protein n=1 Tax=Mycobacterium sp. MS1601 TaxID=1936029 RepID=UPI0012FAD4B6|nr:hypothetical protein [Mycobacterium sp. MS1601]
MSSLLDVIRQNPVAGTTVLPPAVAALLEKVQLPGPVPTGPLPYTDSASATGGVIPGAFGAALDGPVTWTLTQQPGEGFVLQVSGATAATGAPIGAVRAANRTDLDTTPQRATLTPTGFPLTVAFAGALTISGSSTQPATVTAGAGARAVLSTRHLLLPGGFGASLPSTELHLTADGPHLGDVEFIVPTRLPIVGGLVLPADVATVAAGIDVVVPVPRTPAGAAGPHVSGTMTFRLDADASLADLVPLAMSALFELPSGASPFGTGGPPVAETVRIRVTASRPPDDPAAIQVAVTAESDGVAGLARVDQSSDSSAVAAGVTTVLGPAMAARAGTAGAAALGVLYSAASGFGPAFASIGGMVLHSVTLQATTSTSSVPVTLDVEGSVQAKEWHAGPLLRIGMNRPMRVRWCNIRAVIDVTEDTIEDAIRLDLQGARADVVDPGGWVVDGPGNLFEVIGSRGGSGSTWFEVDLRFTVDLGPVRVSGATIRATFADDALSPVVGLRGLDASVELPGVLRGGGKVSIAQQLDIALWAQIVPLRVNGFVSVTLDGPRVVLSAGVDLPAPILLGPTGLGLFSLAATIGTNSGMPVPDPADPMKSLRMWRPWNGLEDSPGDLTLGAAVVIGTTADDGFTANALGVVGVTVPDFALRIGLDAAFVHDRRDGHELSDRNDIATHSADPGLFILGGLSATPSALDIGLEAHLTVPYLFKMDIPAAGHFDAAGWWMHLGSDDRVGGVPTGRPPGPMRATVFPGLGPLQVDAGWAFLMIRGNGIEKLAGTNQTLQGFSVAAGIGFSQVFGLKPVLWAEVSASLIAAIGTRPVTVWAQGRLDGRVGLGPFRIGVSAQAEILLAEGRVDLHFEVCAVVDLFFTELKGCIDIGSDTAPLTQAPAPDPWPLPTITLADGLGRLLTDPLDPTAGHLAMHSGDGPAGGWSATPKVWPDTIPLLTFPIAPVIDSGAGIRHEVHAGLSGSGRFQHEWHLSAVRLERITDAGPVPIPLDTVSAWQVPSDVSADAPTAVTSDQRQLALLTVQQGLSLVHQAAPADGSIPPSVAQAADTCHWRPRAGAAWTFGGDARRLPEPRQWRVLPRDSLLGFPTRWPTFTRAVGFDVHSPDVDPKELLAGVTTTGWVDDGGVLAFAAPVDVDGESFEGALRLWGRTSAGTEEQPPPARHQILLREPIADGYLLIDTGHGPRDDASWLAATVITSSGSRPAQIERADGPPGLWRVLLSGGSPCQAVELQSDQPRPLAVLGLWATASAMVRHAAASTSDAAKLTELPPTSLVDGTGRVVLDADSRYRISVTLAYRDRVDALTSTVVADSRTVHWFFRTAGRDPKAKAAQTGGAAAAAATPWADTVVAPWKSSTTAVTTKTAYSQINRFDPAFLSRYLTGYTPDDHDQFHFTGDSVSATFLAPHIAALAARMGRGITLTARRTDRSDGPRLFVTTDLVHAVLPDGVHGKGLSAADLLGRAAREIGCPAMPDGAKLGGLLPLQPQTPYELSVGLPLTGQTFRTGDPELDGITFTTSAYDGPHSLIESFNLVPDNVPLASAPTAHGDLAIGAGGSGDSAALLTLSDEIITGDAELEHVLASIGLPPLRPVAGPRSTVLWAKTDSWGVAGLLMESPEPLDRQGRMGIHAATVNATALPVVRQSQSGSRVLWLRRGVIQLSQPTWLTVTADDRGATFKRRLRVQPRPRFLQGVIKAAQL